MVNIKDELVNFPSIDTVDMAANGAEIPDNIRNAIVLYNKAIESLRMDSEDIAIIGLKKAVSIYPEFYEAINLLGLCYAYINDYEKASEMFQRVTKAENNGSKALNYLKQINIQTLGEAGRPPEKKRTVFSSAKEHTATGKEKKTNVKASENKQPEKPETPIEKKPVPQQQEKSLFDQSDKSLVKNDQKSGRKARKKSAPNLGSFTFSRTKALTSRKKRHSLAFAIVILLLGFMAIFIYISMQYAADTNKGGEIQSPVNDYNVLEQKYNNLNNDYIELKKIYDAAKAELSSYKVSEKLLSAESLISAQNFEQAADILIQLKSESLNDDNLNKFNQLWSKCIPQACQTVYNQGISLFDGNKFNEAVVKLVKLRTYDSSYKYLNYALYCLGKCYDRLNNTQAAVEAFQAVIDRFPGTDYAVWSQNKINEIKSR